MTTHRHLGMDWQASVASVAVEAAKARKRSETASTGAVSRLRYETEKRSYDLSGYAKTTDVDEAVETAEAYTDTAITNAARVRTWADVSVYDEFDIDAASTPDEVFSEMWNNSYNGGIAILPTGLMTDDDWNAPATGIFVLICDSYYHWTNTTMPSRTAFLCFPRELGDAALYIRYQDMDTLCYEGTDWYSIAGTKVEATSSAKRHVILTDDDESTETTDDGPEETGGIVEEEEKTMEESEESEAEVEEETEETVEEPEEEAEEEVEEEEDEESADADGTEEVTE